MTRRNMPAILAAAAAMIFSGVVWAADAPSGGGAAGAGAGAGQSDQQQGQGQTQGDRGQGQGQGRGQGRGGADMQINQQLQQFAQDPNTAADKCFVLMAAIDNEFEIQGGQAAQQKSQNDQVKQIAQKMVDDHTKAKQQFQQVAQQLQVQLPEQLPRMKQAELQIMSALPADQFDKHYLAHLQAAHAKDVTKFNSVSQLSQNDQVKQFASQLLPVLQQHAQHVNQTATAMGLPSGMEAVQAGATIQGSGASGASGASGSSSSGTSDSGRSSSGSSGSSSGGAGGSSSGGASGGQSR